MLGDGGGEREGQPEDQRGADRDDGQSQPDAPRSAAVAGWGESNGDDAAACGARAGCVGDGGAQFFGATVSVWIRTSSFGGPSPLPSLVPSLAMAATTSSPAVTLPNGV